MKLEYPLGATPLDPNEFGDLLPKHLLLQSELNEWEEANILKTHLWLARKTSLFSLDSTFCKTLHLRMFNETWKWAGRFRQSDKNIGVDWSSIPVRLHDPFQDVQAQLQYQSFDLEEIATRFHHRLVLIHPFPNGNGRHARLMTDLLLKAHHAPPFSWGATQLTAMSDTRIAYIQALRAADKHDYQQLCILLGREAKFSNIRSKSLKRKRPQLRPCRLTMFQRCLNWYCPCRNIEPCC